MFVTSYIVRVCDNDPFSDLHKNIIPYRFTSRRKAMRFVKDALSRNLCVVMIREDMEVYE